jgi:hypothetical protein
VEYGQNGDAVMSNGRFERDFDCDVIGCAIEGRQDSIVLVQS